MFDLEKELDKAGYKFEFTYGEFGYEWSETRVYTKDRRVFTLSDAGCSCTYFGVSYQDIHTAIGDMYEVTKVPSLQELENQRGEWSHWDTPIEEIQHKYEDLGLRY